MSSKDPVISNENPPDPDQEDEPYVEEAFIPEVLLNLGPEKEKIQNEQLNKVDDFKRRSEEFWKSIGPFRDEDFGDRVSDWDGQYGYKPLGSLRARDLYDRYMGNYRNGKSGSRRHYTTDELAGSRWLHVVDNDFASVLKERLIYWEEARRDGADCRVCGDCISGDIFIQRPKTEIEEFTIQIAELKETIETCDICRLVYRCFQRHNLQNQEVVKLFRDGSAVSIKKYGPAILTTCAGPEYDDRGERLQIGLPVLPTIGSPAYFELLSNFLTRCDNSELHRRYGCHSDSKSPLPTRVLDVGAGPGSTSLRLYCSAKGELGEYMALSHCWGNLDPEVRAKFCTYLSNLNARQERIDINELPQTFKDAIRVVRELGKQYLWIDSLCIIQDDRSDWEREAKKMENVFNNAYCTIAATSSKDSTQGFLHERPKREYVMITDPPAELYVCEGIDNFREDVENGLLNQRGWVLQERALSKRILHFTDKQTYWECGLGVHCETLTLMYNSQTYILGDPKFPDCLRQRTDDSQLSFAESIFETYTQLGLTYSTDKPIAISGLEKRLGEDRGLYSKVKHGIIEKFLHRSLLWQRLEGATMTRIQYPEDRKVPSWSWMAYDGTVSYMELDYEVRWSETIPFPEGDSLEVSVREFKPFEIEEKEGAHVLKNKRGIEKGQLVFDQSHTSFDRLKCVVVGQNPRNFYNNESRTRYYLLLVIPVDEEVVDGNYERVGVGTVDEDFVYFRRPAVEVHVI